jgi:hypothetical protein
MFSPPNKGFSINSFFKDKHTQRNKKGHHYIVPTLGPPRPVRNTQAMPRFGALTFVRFLTSKFGG